MQVKCEKWEYYIKYYYKKVVNLIVQMLFYMLLRCALESGWNILNIDFRIGCLKNIASENSGWEYWYLYALGYSLERLIDRK